MARSLSFEFLIVCDSPIARPHDAACSMHCSWPLDASADDAGMSSMLIVVNDATLLSASVLRLTGIGFP